VNTPPFITSSSTPLFSHSHGCIEEVHNMRLIGIT
jgi:hypothetical protein